MKNISLVSDLVTTFTIFDDISALLKINKHIAGRNNSLSVSEVAVISLIKSQYCIKTWKGLYKLLRDKYSNDFNLPHYKNFVMTMNKYSKILLIIINFLMQINNKDSGEIKIIDSTPLPVCKNMRIRNHKTMKQIATRSKSSMGWFYGLKLHIVTDLLGNILMCKFTTANVSDRKVLDEFLEILKNSIILADAGYLSKKSEMKASKRNNILKVVPRKNMRKVATYLDICLLNLRPRIEVVFSVLKERLNLVTSLPRSIDGYLAHYIHVLFGYTFKNLIS